MTAASVRRTVTVERPVQAVADYLSDFTTSARWDPYTVECDRLDDGTAVGARFENIQKIAGRRSHLLYRVSEFEPGVRIVL